MRAFLGIFQLELKALSRSRSLLMLAAASAAWMFVVPRLVVGDGTAEGMREVCLGYGLGGVLALVTVSMLAAAGATHIAFGSEAGELAPLRRAAEALDRGSVTDGGGGEPRTSCVKRTVPIDT